jgi:hypothetical protein
VVAGMAVTTISMTAPISGRRRCAGLTTHGTGTSATDLITYIAATASRQSVIRSAVSGIDDLVILQGWLEKTLAMTNLRRYNLTTREH